MGSQFLIDTNAVIEFLGGTLPSPGSEWIEEIVDKQENYLSVINQIELLGYDAPKDEMKILSDFIDTFEILPLTEDVVATTIGLRKNTKIKLPDAIIAATCLVFELTLVTRNISDFEKIEGLNLVNPHDVQ